MRPPAQPRVAIVGAGRVGTSLARVLTRSRVPVVGVVSQRLAHARRAARLAPGAVATRSLGRGTAGSGLVLIAVPDRAVASLAVALAAVGRWTGRVVLHTCGALGPEALGPLRAAGAATGSLHPLQTFPPADAPLSSLQGVRAAVAGDPAGHAAGRRLARSLGMLPLDLPPAARGAYHLAAVLASNHVVALVDAAVAVLTRAGLSPAAALEALMPLLRGTLDGLERAGLPGALTGPVARGDRTTVARHLEVLSCLDPSLDSLYRSLSQRALRLAAEAGLPALDVRRLRRLLSARTRTRSGGARGSAARRAEDRRDT